MAYKKHEHDFSVLPPNDDEQQCDNDCVSNWHKCSICGKSRSEVAKGDPEEVRQYVLDSTETITKNLTKIKNLRNLKEGFYVWLAQKSDASA